MSELQRFGNCAPSHFYILMTQSEHLFFFLLWCSSVFMKFMASNELIGPDEVVIYTPLLLSLSCLSQVFRLRFLGVGRGRRWRISWAFLRWRTLTGWSTVTLRWCYRMRATRNTSNNTATSQFTAHLTISDYSVICYCVTLRLPRWTEQSDSEIKLTGWTSLKKIWTVCVTHQLPRTATRESVYLF